MQRVLVLIQPAVAVRLQAERAARNFAWEEIRRQKIRGGRWPFCTSGCGMQMAMVAMAALHLANSSQGCHDLILPVLFGIWRDRLQKSVQNQSLVGWTSVFWTAR